MAGLTAQGLAEAYGRAAGAWADGPDRLYGRLAGALVDACPPLAGRRVLDLGAGTGALSRSVEVAGADVVAVDLAVGMLTHRREERPPAVAAEATRLPFAAAVFDAVLANLVINHLPDPTAALREAARVTRTGGTVAVSTFAADWTHPAKGAVDEVAVRFGYEPPDWYTTLKADLLPWAGSETALVEAARAAGLRHPRAVRRTVVGLDTPGSIVAWRLGMAQLAPFVDGLPPETRRRLVDEAIAALGPGLPPVNPSLITLTASAA